MPRGKQFLPIHVGISHVEVWTPATVLSPLTGFTLGRRCDFIWLEVLKRINWAYWCWLSSFLFPLGTRAAHQYWHQPWPCGEEAWGTQHFYNWVNWSHLKIQLTSPFALTPSYIFQPISTNCDILVSICLIVCPIFQLVQNLSAEKIAIYWRAGSPWRFLAGNSVNVCWIDE